MQASRYSGSSVVPASSWRRQRVLDVGRKPARSLFASTEKPPKEAAVSESTIDRKPGRLCQCVLLGEHPAPGLAEHVVAAADAEMVDEVRQFAHEQAHRPEICPPVPQVRRVPVAELVVEDDGRGHRSARSVMGSR